MKRVLAYGPTLQRELEIFIETKRSQLHESTSWGTDFLDRLRPFATSGKLLRGCLVCFSYEMFSGRSADKSVLSAAMAMELTQSALLVHDDIMDGDELRRGQPSLHRQYQTVGEEKNLLDTPQFGINMALSGGDISLFLAFELLAKSGTDPATRSKLHQLFVDQLVDTCIGQMQDVYYEACPDMPPKKAIYGIMRSKTAAYTLALPLAMGAVLASQPATVLRQLRVIGLATGTIFQIRDDELGAMGDSRKTGKPVGADIREGKKTLIYYYLLKQCDLQERRNIKKIFGNPASSKQDITYVQKLIKQYKILALLNDEIAPLEKQALTAIKNLDAPADAKAELKSLVTFCARRQT